MGEISVELVLFIVLGLVFIIDFIIKGLKRSSKKKDDITTLNKVSSTRNKASNKSYKYLKYFIERPRNIGLYLFLISLMKILIHYLVYPKYLSFKFRNSDAPIINYIKTLFSYDKDDPSLLLIMWSISIGLISFIVWQINPYIKKR